MPHRWQHNSQQNVKEMQTQYYITFMFNTIYITKVLVCEPSFKNNPIFLLPLE